MEKIKGYEYLADNLFKVGVQAEVLKNNTGMDVILDKLIESTDEAYLQIIRFVRGFKDGYGDAENMRETINIVESITKENYKEKSFPLPLDKILNSLMGVSEIFNEIDSEAEGDFKKDMKELYKHFHSVFVNIHQYQEKLKEH